LINQEITRRQFLARTILTGTGVALLRGRPSLLSAGEPGSVPTQREIVRHAMAQRPADPWPRGLAHVVLAIPGSQQPEKGYHEPGGSFSPAVGSFGVSIWVRDSAGKLKTTSDSLRLDQIQQRFSWPNPKGVPAIVTTTPHYLASWVKPPYVTPHYWTAGEILALQVEMLAYVDESGTEPVLVIGGGVPKSWVGKPMRVRALPTSLGLVDWSWKDEVMQVSVRGQAPKVRVGKAFGPAARVRVTEGH
jgi:hypothetical protein